MRQRNKAKTVIYVPEPVPPIGYLDVFWCRRLLRCCIRSFVPACTPTLKQFITDEGGVNRSQSLLFASHEQSYKQARNKLCDTDKLNIFFLASFFYITQTQSVIIFFRLVSRFFLLYLLCI